MSAIVEVMMSRLILLAALASMISSGAFSATVTAIPVTEFLNSLGVQTHNDQGYDYEKYIPALQYIGVRNIRDGNRNLDNLLTIHNQTGVLVDVGDGGDLPALMFAARTLADRNALLSIEGPNEPNNFTIHYHGQTGGGSGTWMPVAEFQRDLYARVAADPALNAYPVFSVSEDGAETDNVGLQWLTIPDGARTSMPVGTQYADFANTHNYVSGNCRHYIDNVARKAAEPRLNGCWDGMWGEYYKTWAHGYRGYGVLKLADVPRVTTETGWDSMTDPGGEDVQGKVLVNTYLDQFDEGWSYTFIYQLVDGQGGGGNQGLFHTNLTAKLSGKYIHNLTAILADSGAPGAPGALAYSIADQPDTVHDMLMQKSNGVFKLAVWGEQVTGSSPIVVRFDNQTEGTVNVYDTTVGTTPVQTFTNVKQVALTMSDHAMIVEVIP